MKTSEEPLVAEKTTSVKTMKAIRIHSFGDASVLQYEDAPIPQLLPDEVLIKVHAAGVNPVDWKIRKGGYRGGSITFTLPFILGWDVAGKIDQVGSLVSRFKVGDKVFAKPDGTRNGAYAQFIAVRAHEVALAPKNIPLEQAAGVPLAGQTAWVGLFEKGNLQKDQSVLIHAGAGGVGSFAIQFAKAAGAHVISTCSKGNIDLVKSLGADEVIDYHAEDFSKKVSNVDVVLDTIGGETQAKSFAVIKKGGILVSTLGEPDAKEAAKYGIRGAGFMVMPCGARLQEIAALADKGLLKVMVEKEFPLQEVKEAHKLSEAGHVRGKVILRVSQ